MSIVTGRLSQAPLVKLNQKSSLATFAHWLKVSSDKTKRNQGKLDRAGVRACLLLDKNATREDLIILDSLSSLGVINTGITQFCGGYRCDVRLNEQEKTSDRNTECLAYVREAEGYRREKVD